MCLQNTNIHDIYLTFSLFVNFCSLAGEFADGRHLSQSSCVFQLWWNPRRYSRRVWRTQKQNFCSHVTLSFVWFLFMAYFRKGIVLSRLRPFVKCNCNSGNLYRTLLHLDLASSVRPFRFHAQVFLWSRMFSSIFLDFGSYWYQGWEAQLQPNSNANFKSINICKTSHD